MKQKENIFFSFEVRIAPQVRDMSNIISVLWSGKLM